MLEQHDMSSRSKNRAHGLDRSAALQRSCNYSKDDHVQTRLRDIKGARWLCRLEELVVGSQPRRERCTVLEP